MKRIFIVGVSLIAIAAAATGAANAADLSTQAPVYTKAPKPAYNWTGLYLGIEGGAGWGNARQTDSTGFDSGTYQPNGAFVGGTLGYNWQLNSPWVVGLEGDAAWADIGATTPGTDPSATIHSTTANGFGTIAGCGGNIQACTTTLEGFETVRGRLGYAFGYVMPYVTGGLAVGQVHAQEGDVAANGAFGSGSTTMVGYTVGAGVESMILPRWTVKLEGLWSDLGNHTVFNDTIPTVKSPVAQSVSFQPAFIKIGVNYKLY
jgi:outer membrane immunogenic protein